MVCISEMVIYTLFTIMICATSTGLSSNIVLFGSSGSGKDTKRDLVLKEIWKLVQDHKLFLEIDQYFNEHDMDTDGIENDLKLFHEESNSNLYATLSGNNHAMEKVHGFLRHHRIINRSFATGYPLFYWEWWRTAKRKDVVGRGRYRHMDFGDRKISDLSVYPRFKDIREEVMATNLISKANFDEFGVQKAAEYFETKHCRKIKSKPWGGGFGDL